MCLIVPPGECDVGTGVGVRVVELPVVHALKNSTSPITPHRKIHDQSGSAFPCTVIQDCMWLASYLLRKMSNLTYDSTSDSITGLQRCPGTTPKICAFICSSLFSKE